MRTIIINFTFRVVLLLAITHGYRFDAQEHSACGVSFKMLNRSAVSSKTVVATLGTAASVRGVSPTGGF